jgi:hypothetical protein
VELERRGIFTAIGTGRAARFQWDECLRAFVAYQAERLAEKRLRQLLADQAGPSYSVSRARLAAAQAARIELKLSREQQQLLTLDDFKTALGDAYMRIRAKLLIFAPRAAGVVVGALTLPEAQARLEPIVREIMEELCAADDVPAGGDHNESREEPNDE